MIGTPGYNFRQEATIPAMSGNFAVTQEMPTMQGENPSKDAPFLARSTTTTENPLASNAAPKYKIPNGGNAAASNRNGASGLISSTCLLT
jgi:hypothetical protein